MTITQNPKPISQNLLPITQNLLPITHYPLPITHYPIPKQLLKIMKIRDAVETDLPAIVDIYNAAIPGRMATADLEMISVESRIPWYQEHQAQTRPVWVIELDEQILGWLSFQVFYNRPAYNSTAEVSIYVHPEYQGQGIGKRLLAQAVHRSPSLGLKALLALIFAHNQPSLELFKRFDFEQWGYLPRVADLDGIERDLVIMGRHLTPTTND